VVIVLVKSGSISKMTLLFIRLVSDQTVAAQTAALISLQSNVPLLPIILWNRVVPYFVLKSPPLENSLDSQDI
jgi:hypothetical protein